MVDFAKLGHGLIGVRLFLYPLQFLFNGRDIRKILCGDQSSGYAFYDSFS